MQEEYRKLSLWMTYSVSKNSKSLEEKVIVIREKHVDRAGNTISIRRRYYPLHSCYSYIWQHRPHLMMISARYVFCCRCVGMAVHIIALNVIQKTPK